MLRWLFNPRSPRNLDQLIYDLAEHQRDADYEEFYARMLSHRFFFPAEADPSVPLGQAFVVGPGMRVTMPVSVVQGLRRA